MVNPRNRGSSGSPMPPNSRTNSTTSTPKLKKKHGPTAMSSVETAAAAAAATPNGPPTLAPTASGVSSIGSRSTAEDLSGPEFSDPPKFLSSPPKKGSKSKSSSSKGGKAQPKAKAPPPPSNSIFCSVKKVVRTTLFTGLVAYIAIVCPHDNDLESPLCRTLVHARDDIHTPFIQPILNKITSHPKVKSVVDPVYNFGEPIVTMARPYWIGLRGQLNSQYIKHSVPLYAEIEKQSRPYVSQARDIYKREVDPYYLAYVQPTFDTADRVGGQVYELAKPYAYKASLAAHQAWLEAQPHLYVLAAKLTDVPDYIGTHVVEPLNQFYRTYVDPQIAKMAKALEDSPDQPKSTGGFGKSFMAKAERTGDLPKQVKVPHEATPDDLLEGEEEDCEDEEVLEPAHTGSIPAPEPESTAKSTQDAPVTTSQTTSQDTVPDDLADFLAEFATPDHTVEEPAPAPENTISEEEAAAERRRLLEEETAIKRADIDKRHTEWEKQLKALVEKTIADLPAKLEQARAIAMEYADDLVLSSEEQDAAEKSLAGAKLYIERLKKDQTKSVEEKVAQLQQVMKKIGDKFTSVVDKAQESASNWWTDIQESEAKMIDGMVAEARALADRAQANLGMDYSWLDDVTVKDWSRYHALLGEVKAMNTRLLTMALGNEHDSPKNPVAELIQEVNAEFLDMKKAFQEQVDLMTQQAIQWFKGEVPLRVQDPSELPYGINFSEDEDIVETQPVKPGKDTKIIPEDIEVPPIFVGKAKEQIERDIQAAEQAAAREHIEL